MTRTEMTRTMIRTKAAPFNDGSIEPNLGSRYGEIGISAVTAALQYKNRAGCKHVTGRLHSTAHLLRTTRRTARKVARAGGHTLNPPDQVFLKRSAACERVAELSRNPKSRFTWRRMADRWHRCAKVAAFTSATAPLQSRQETLKGPPASRPV